MTHRIIASTIAAMAMLGLAACGSSSGSATSSSTPADATKSVDSVSCDISNLDASQQSSAGASISAKSVASARKRMGSDVGDASRSGCELNQIKTEGIRMGKQTDAILCYLGTTQDQISSFVVDGTQRYYSVTVPAMKGDENEGAMSFLMRIQKAGGTLSMDMCEGATPLLSEEFTVTQSGQTVTAIGYHHFKGEDGGPGSGFEDKGGFDLTVTLKDSATGDIDYSDVDSGSLVGKFLGEYGSGQMTFAKTAGQDLNDVSGVFKGQFGPTNDSFTAQIVGRTDATKGAAKHSVSGSFPAIPKSVFPTEMQSIAPNGFCPLSDGFESCDIATNFGQGGSCMGQAPTLTCLCMQAPTDGKCTFTDTGTESFTITTTALTGRQTFIKTAANEYHTAVDAMSLPSTDITAPAATRNWDCSTTGQTVVAIDASAVDYTVCDSKIEKGLDSSEHNSCQETETNDKAEGGVEDLN